jgi:tRNA-modifying protein YgfZ
VSGDGQERPYPEGMTAASPSVSDQVAALEAGRAFVDLSMWRKVRVGGSEAMAWLNDLLAADLDGLAPGTSRRSLLLSPTGRVRAEVAVLADDQGFVLIQDPAQDSRIDDALAPYVLSSDVAVHDVTAELGLLAFPGVPADRQSNLGPGVVSRPSVLGSGFDLLPSPEDVEGGRANASGAGLTEATLEALEAWSIRRGRPRVGVDLGPDALPHEAAVGDLIGYHKGCFLGQEAVAKVRNLGHPPFVLLAVSGHGPLSPGDPVWADGADVGLVTSADVTGSPETAAIVRVRWASRDADLRSADGEPLAVRATATLSD